MSATLQCLFPVLQHSFVLLKNKMSTHIILTNICSLLYDCLKVERSTERSGAQVDDTRTLTTE